MAKITAVKRGVAVNACGGSIWGWLGNRIIYHCDKGHRVLPWRRISVEVVPQRLEHCTAAIGKYEKYEKSHPEDSKKHFHQSKLDW